MDNQFSMALFDLGSTPACHGLGLKWMLKDPPHGLSEPVTTRPAAGLPDSYHSPPQPATLPGFVTVTLSAGVLGEVGVVVHELGAAHPGALRAGQEVGQGFGAA